jgi:hypothetical protein
MADEHFDSVLWNVNKLLLLLLLQCQHLHKVLENLSATLSTICDINTESYNLEFC